MEQDELGRALRQMVPPVDETGVWDSVTQRAGRRHTRARILITKRFIGLAAAAVIVLVAAGFGINALVEYLGQRDRVLVVTDDVMSPGATGAAAVPAEQRAKYGQILSFGNLELCVTVSPTAVPVTEEDAPESGAKRWGSKHLRSQIIVQNVGDEAQLFTAADVVLESAGGTREVHASTDSEPVPVEPGEMLVQRLDWIVVADAKIAAVVYAPEEAAAAALVWGPGTLVEGKGYPVLQSLPTLRPEDVTSIEVSIDDPQGGPPSVEVHQAGEPGVDLERLRELYAQTTLVPTEGYPTFRLPVQVTLHLTDGSALAVGLSAAGGDECTIQYTRAGGLGTPPSAVGRNAALVYGFFAEGTGGAGITNASGLTYGSSLWATRPEDEPDLIAAEATNGKAGYVYATDLEGPEPSSPAEALAQQAANMGKTRTIPVYEANGRTVIGEFIIEPGTSVEIAEPLE